MSVNDKSKIASLRLTGGVLRVLHGVMIGIVLLYLVPFLAAVSDNAKDYGYIRKALAAEEAKPPDAKAAEPAEARAATLPFGGDKWGRDVLKKTIKGSETSIFVGLAKPFDMQMRRDAAAQQPVDEAVIEIETRLIPCALSQRLHARPGDREAVCRDAEARHEVDVLAGDADRRVGVADAVSKTVAYRLIEPATHLPTPVRIVCREWKLESLLAELSAHRLDLVIAGAPIPASGQAGVTRVTLSSRRSKMQIRVGRTMTASGRPIGSGFLSGSRSIKAT